MLRVSSPLASAAERGASRCRLRTTLLPRMSSQAGVPASKLRCDEGLGGETQLSWCLPPAACPVRPPWRAGRPAHWRPPCRGGPRPGLYHSVRTPAGSFRKARPAPGPHQARARPAPGFFSEVAWLQCDSLDRWRRSIARPAHDGASVRHNRTLLRSW